MNIRLMLSDKRMLTEIVPTSLWPHKVVNDYEQLFFGNDLFSYDFGAVIAE